MPQQDDPEDRIRNLEGARDAQYWELTNSSSEIGQEAAPPTRVDPQAPHVPPPPGYGGYGAPFGYGAHGGQPPYGTPYPPPPAPASPSGTNWVIWGVVAGAVGAISVGVVTFVGMMSRDSPGEVRSIPTVSMPSVSGGGGPFGEPSGGNRPSAPVAEPTEELASPGTVVSVSGARENKTVACADGDVRISGVSNTVVITGACASVTVSGIENVITVDSSVKISVSGIDNQVTYMSGVPEVDNSGDGNVVTPG